MKTVITSLVILAFVLGIFVWSPGNSYAITNGRYDGDGHPYVGAVLFFDENDQLLWFCSGALISPTVVLTAGHCTDETDYALVSFDPEAINVPFDEFTRGFPYTHPDFRVGLGQGLPRFNTHDVGVVVLDEPVIMTTYAQLPSEGLVDLLRMNTDVTIVGYGVQLQTRGNPPHQWVNFGMRFYASSKLIQSNDVISDEFIKLTANPGQGKGGFCFGDSGGPDLLNGTNIILSINSFGNNYNCTGVNYSNRIDTSDILDFVNVFLP